MNTHARTILTKLSIQEVGQGLMDLDFSREPIELQENDETSRIASFFLKGFNMEAAYQFSGMENPDSSQLKELIEDYFHHKFEFHKLSEEIAREWVRLQPTPSFPGELIVCQFSEINETAENCPGIGIFLVRSKEKFLQINRIGARVSVKIEEGINLKKLLECVLILHSSENSPATVFFKLNAHEFSENFFIHQFIKALPVQNNYFNTSYHLNMLKAYVDETMTEEAPLEKIDKLNRSKEYFTNHEHFNHKEYESALFEDPDHITSFEKFRNQYAKDNEIPLVDEFEISPHAVKKNFHRIRSVIKLDKNFHIYVHGNPQNIIRGYDPEKGKHFYQLFFDEES